MNTLTLAGVGKLDTIAQVPLVKLWSPPALQLIEGITEINCPGKRPLFSCCAVTFVGWWKYRRGH